MGCQNTKVVAENVETESKQHIMISYSWETGQKRISWCIGRSNIDRNILV